MSAEATATEPATTLPAAARMARFWVLAAIPLSLTSPGATLAMGLAGAFGIYFWRRAGAVPQDMLWAGRATIALYGLVLAVDVLNGGGFGNLTSTGVNYLPLIAVVPFAIAVRTADVAPETLDRVMQVSIALAAIGSAVQYFLLERGPVPPGGLNLNPIPYAFALTFWGMWQLSRGLSPTGLRPVPLAFALLAVLPVLLALTKLVLACLILGYGVVAVCWALATGNRRALLPGGLAAAAILALALATVLRPRVTQLAGEVGRYFSDGTLDTAGNSFGPRLEMARLALRSFLDAPFIGHGLDERMASVLAYETPATRPVAWMGHLHNDYMTHLVSFGLPGLAFIGLFFAFLWLLSRRVPAGPLRWFAVAIVPVYALYMGFEVVFNMDPVSGPLAVIAGLVLALGGQSRSA